MTLPLAALLLCAGLCAPALAQTYEGQARAIDGDTLAVTDESPAVGQVRIRLAGIDAPELRQTCAGRDGQTYECGRDAAAVLAELVRGKTVTCKNLPMQPTTPPPGWKQATTDRYGRTIATCSTDAGDLGEQMVRRGWALDYTRYSGGAYAAAEVEAKRERLGIWAGKFEIPADFRRGER